MDSSDDFHLDQSDALPKDASPVDPAPAAVGRETAFNQSVPIPADGFPAMPPVACAESPQPINADPKAPAPARPWMHFAKWTLAIVGTFFLSVALQVVMVSVGGVAVALFSIAAGDTSTALTDEMLLATMVIAQLAEIAVVVPWWGHLCGRACAPRRALGGRVELATVARTVLAFLLIALAIQYLLDPLFAIVGALSPETLEEYNELMEESSVGVFSLLSVFSSAILAPVCEEILCRGIMFEFALRAVSPGWTKEGAARGSSVSVKAFWIANAMQALAFGILHLNPIQGAYAFALGLLLGWLYWRTGKLRYPIAFHLVFNSLSFVVEPLSELFDAIPLPLFYPAMVLLLFWGFKLFGRMWNRGDGMEVEFDAAPAGASAAEPVPTDEPALADASDCEVPSRDGLPTRPDNL